MLTINIYTVEGDLVVVRAHDDVPIAAVGNEGALHFDAAISL